MVNHTVSFIIYRCIAALLVVTTTSLVRAELILPEGVKQDEYCKGCRETVEALELYTEENPNSIEYLEACQRKYFKKNEQPMTQKLKTCDHMLDYYEEEVPKMIKNLPWEQFQVWFCHERTFACIGVYSDSKLSKGEKAPSSDEEFVRQLKAAHKGRIITPHPAEKDEL